MKLLTIKEAMELMRIEDKEANFKRYYLYGKYPRIPSIRLQHERLIDESDIITYLKSQKTMTRRQMLNR